MPQALPGAQLLRPRMGHNPDHSGLTPSTCPHSLPSCFVFAPQAPSLTQPNASVDPGGEEMNSWLSMAPSPGPLLGAHSHSIRKEVATETQPDLFSSPEHYAWVFIFTDQRTKNKLSQRTMGSK